MNTQFTQNELTNLLVIINAAPITGKEAQTVAMLQQKIKGMMHTAGGLSGLVQAEASKKEENKNA